MRQDQRRAFIRANHPNIDINSPGAHAFIIYGGDLQWRMNNQRTEMTGRQRRTAKRDAMRAAIRQQITTKLKRVPSYREVAKEATQIIRKLTRPQRRGVM